MTDKPLSIMGRITRNLIGGPAIRRIKEMEKRALKEDGVWTKVRDKSGQWYEIFVRAKDT